MKDGQNITVFLRADLLELAILEIERRRETFDAYSMSSLIRDSLRSYLAEMDLAETMARVPKAAPKKWINKANERSKARAAAPSDSRGAGTDPKNAAPIPIQEAVNIVREHVRKTVAAGSDILIPEFMGPKIENVWFGVDPAMPGSDRTVTSEPVFNSTALPHSNPDTIVEDLKKIDEMMAETEVLNPARNTWADKIVRAMNSEAVYEATMKVVAEARTEVAESVPGTIVEVQDPGSLSGSADAVAKLTAGLVSKPRGLAERLNLGAEPNKSEAAPRKPLSWWTKQISEMTEMPGDEATRRLAELTGGNKPPRELLRNPAKLAAWCAANVEA